MGKKVSIITPCLNGEKFVSRYLDSILNQTYKNIELIFVNDGSKDKTEEIVKKYIPKFKNEGMELIYIYQNNFGQAAALNKGLKIFSGDYLTWPDSDDFLSKDSIEKKVRFLEENKEYGMVRSAAAFYDEGNLRDVKYYWNCKGNINENIFEDLITEKAYLCCGCYMIKSSCFLDVNQERSIYESRAGQNWQMLLPVSYKYKCGYIDEPLYNIVIREDSHSRNDENRSLDISLQKALNHEDILINILDKMFNEKNKYHEIVELKYIRKRLSIGYQYKNEEICKEQINKLLVRNQLMVNDRITYIRCKYQFMDILFSIIFKINNKIKSIF